MEILLGTQGLSGPLPYLTTVFEQLERLGHEVLVFTAEEGPPPTRCAWSARSAGCRSLRA